MNATEMKIFAENFLSAWNSQDVERVVGCYTDDLIYRDPNTRGEIRTPDAMRHYLRKLFARWRMHWSAREVHPFATGNGAAVLWHASFRKTDGEQTVEVDGMDYVEIRDGRICRNEVHFDRAALAALMSGAAA